MSRAREGGWVTVEMAFAALGISLALVFCVGVLQIGLGQIHCNDATAEIARQAARDDLAAVNEVTQRLPDSSSVTIDLEEDRVVVSVSIRLHPWGTWLPSIDVRSTSTAIREGGW